MKSYEKMPKVFFLKNTFEVAVSLLGTFLFTRDEQGRVTGGKIVETEVYLGGIDKASHSYRGRRTKRTAIQFEKGGRAYIFTIYGKYLQFCVVTGPEGVSDVVLIRSLEPVVGLEAMRERRGRNLLRDLTTGPGKLCQALGIARDLYGADLTGNRIWITPCKKEICAEQILVSPRVGIDYAEEFADKYWRFYVAGNPFVSKRDKRAKRLVDVEPREFFLSRLPNPACSGHGYAVRDRWRFGGGVASPSE